MKETSVKGMVLKIEQKEGRWLVNGKRWEGLNSIEKNFLSKFFIEMNVKVEKEEMRISNKWFAEFKKNADKIHNNGDE